jgi:hypothetical protein
MMPPRSAFRLPANFWRSLFAVLAGNAIYLLLERSLPPRARHEPHAVDWGLAVDFWICLACYGLLSLFRRDHKRTSGHQ